jgi:putative glutamine amidotransferase
MTEKQRPVLGVISCNRTVETQAAQAVMTRYLVSANAMARSSTMRRGRSIPRAMK